MKQQLAFFGSIGEQTGNNNKALLIERVFTNSKESVKNGLFIPIQGERFDGHDFIEEAIANGAVASYWQKEKEIPDHLRHKIAFILVEDTLQALQQTAKLFLTHVRPTVVAITGSNGKTTTKDLVSALLSRSFITFKTQGNHNNHIGMPLTILEMDESCEVLILEMGMSNLGEISFLSQLAQPHFAIITNIGDSHLEQLGTRENIAKAKMEIRDGLVNDGTLIIDGDEPLLAPLFDNERVIACGFNDNCHIPITILHSNESEQVFRLNGESITFTLPLLGRHNVKNAAYAIRIAKKLGVTEAAIQEGLTKIQLTGMRLERKRGKNDSLMINDAYNASPTSMIAAIESLSLLQDYPTKIAVLGDMYELGKNEQALHRKVADYIGDNIETVICIGEKGKWIGDALKEKNWDGTIHICESKEAAKSQLEPLLTKETVVLFKASRGMQLETLIDELGCR